MAVTLGYVYFSFQLVTEMFSFLICKAAQAQSDWMETDTVSSEPIAL